MKNKTFNAIVARDAAVDWIKTEAKRANFNKVVIGISGGKDSTIAAALCCRALGKENVHGILLPNNIQSDIDDSIEVCKALGIKYDTINIKLIYDAFLLQYGFSTVKDDVEITQDDAGCIHFVDKNKEDVEPTTVTEEAKINLAPRIRMTMLRLWGQSNHHRLCGTGNYSEITVGYCTKDGDTSCDFNPLGRLTSIEVVEIGKTMEEIPLHLVVKTPSDGLCGLSDEEKLGVSYQEIHNYIRNIDMDKEVWDKIHKMDLMGLHKRTTAPVFDPDLKLLYT